MASLQFRLNNWVFIMTSSQVRLQKLNVFCYRCKRISFTVN